MMARVVWLASVCLAIVCAAVTVRSVPIAAITGASANLVADAAGFVVPASSGDVLTVFPETNASAKADRLLVVKAAEVEGPTIVPVSLPESSQATRTKSVANEVVKPVPVTVRRILSRHWHDPLAGTSDRKVPEQRSEKNMRGRKKAITASAPATETASCPEGNAFLKTLRLVPACETVVANADLTSQ